MTLAARLNRNAIDPFESLGLDAFVRNVFAPEAQPSANYNVDVYEDATTLYIDAELPGFTRDQLDVSVHEGVLTITADRPTPAPTVAAPTNAEGQPTESLAAPTWHVRERRAAKVRRSFGLPKTVEGSSVSATLTDGVLHLSLAKVPEVKPRKITIA